MPAAVLCQVGGGDGQAGPLHACHRSPMFLGLAPDFAVEEGSKDEPEGRTSGGRVDDVSDLNSEHLLSHTQLCAESIINQSS